MAHVTIATLSLRLPQQQQAKQVYPGHLEGDQFPYGAVHKITWYPSIRFGNGGDSRYPEIGYFRALQPRDIIALKDNVAQLLQHFGHGGGPTLQGTTGPDATPPAICQNLVGGWAVGGIGMLPWGWRGGGGWPKASVSGGKVCPARAWRATFRLCSPRRAPKHTPWKRPKNEVTQTAPAQESCKLGYTRPLSLL